MFYKNYRIKHETYDPLGQTHKSDLTDNEKDLHQDVADTRRVAGRGATVFSHLHRREANVVGNSNGYVEGGQQDQPIPAGLERAVVKEDEARLLDVCHFVLRDRVCVGSENALEPKTDTNIHIVTLRG